MRFPDYIPAQRADVPDYIQAEFLQHRADLEANEYNDQRKRDRNALPGELYGAYSDVTGTNPIADALKRQKDKLGGPPTPRGTGTDPSMSSMSGISPVPAGSAVSGGPAPASSALPQGFGGGTSAAAGSTGASPMAGVAARSAVSGGPAPASSALPAATRGMQGAAAGGGANLGGNVAGKTAAAGSASSTVPIAGAAVAPAITAASGGSDAQVAKSAVGSGASTALATAGPTLAATGPMGWAAIAALAAGSLYGMLG